MGAAVVLEDLRWFVSLEDDVISATRSDCAAPNSYVLIAVSTGRGHFQVLMLDFLARCANILIPRERFILIVEQISASVGRHLEQSDSGGRVLGLPLVPARRTRE